MLLYHQATCELLGITPVADGAARLAVEEQERRLGMRLPAAVAEWYALPAGLKVVVDQCHHHSKPLPKLGEPFEDWYYAGPRDFVRQGLLLVGHECEGVANWAVPLDEGPDPRVLVEFDSAPDEVWQTYAPSFSEYAFTLVWDRLAFGLPHYLVAHDPLLRPADLELLDGAFTQQPRSRHFPGGSGATTYRFERPGQRVVIWDAPLMRQVDWYLLASTVEGLEALVRTLWGCGSLAERLYEVPRGAPGRQVLAALRRDAE